MTSETYEEKWHRRGSLLKFYFFIAFIFLVICAITVAVVFYTPVKKLVPGYPSDRVIDGIVQSRLKLDSLEYEIKLRDKYFENIKSIIGGDPSDFESSQDSGTNQHENAEENINHSSTHLMNKHFNRDLFMDYSVRLYKEINFYKPIEGIISEKYNASEKHYAIDIVAAEGEVVKSILDGTVVLSTWTIETGHIIQIQHENSFVSVYKHLSNYLKRQGDKVEAGTPIAIIGNSGEYSSGTHLHFELWHEGNPINPEDYIIF